MRTIGPPDTAGRPPPAPAALDYRIRSGKFEPWSALLRDGAEQAIEGPAAELTVSHDEPFGLRALWDCPGNAIFLERGSGYDGSPVPHGNLGYEYGV